MKSEPVLLCACPDLPFSPEDLRERLAGAGVAARLLPPLCTPAGLRQLRAELSASPGGRLLAACGPDVNAGLFSRVADGRDLPVVDLLACPDLTLAVSRVLLAAAGPAPGGPSPAADPPAPAVLVVGGGIGGVQTALDLANGGLQVYLADASLSIGGTMAQLDKTFPTLDCSICILGPKLVEVAHHPNIELLTYSVIDRLAGQAGRFTVDLTLKPRYVDISKCVGCGSCTEVCPVIVPSRWHLGLKARKCIRIIFAQAVPLMATIEKDYCIDCRLCVAACGREAIDLDDAPRSRRLEVGAIVLATGAKPLDPSLKGEYGYGAIPGVITNLEFERLVSASGPTQGSLITPAGDRVERLAFLQCVGSRDRRFLPYCSGYCCTASIKQAMLALEHNPRAQVTIFFNDIRTSGKGFEELYQRARQAGVRFIKGLPGRITADDSGHPVIFFEDRCQGAPGRLAVDLAVLAVGLAPPSRDLPFAAEPPARTPQGFYRARHPVLHPLESTLPGVFLVGTCQGPGDISDTVCQASGAAGRIFKLLYALRREESTN